MNYTYTHTYVYKNDDRPKSDGREKIDMTSSTSVFSREFVGTAIN